jgi:predicted MFS family arabinose efflux permease
VTNYAHLVLARIAAAVGESGGKPPTYSLVGDYFPNSAERTRALAIYMAGSPLSSLFSFIVGGWLSQVYGWRATFFIVGIPALVLALAVALTVKEPRVHGGVALKTRKAAPAMRAVLVVLWQCRSLRHLCVALILLYTMGLGMAPWYAAFMMRVHGIGTAEVGWWFGLIFGLGGIAGTLLGGYVATARFGGDERAQMRMSAMMVAAILPCFVGFLILPGKFQALGALALLLIVFSSYLGPAYALMQRLVPDEMRATMLALVMLLANLIGFGLGPQVVGILSDRLRPVAGAESLRYAMLVLSFVALWAAYHFWKAGNTVHRDLYGREMGEAARDSDSAIHQRC